MPLSEERIQAIIDEIQRRTSTVLLRSAEQMSRLSANETIALLRRQGYLITEDEKQDLIKRVVEARIATYTAGLKKGGSECVERVLTRMKDGRVKATTAVKFVPWLSDRNTKEADAILKLVHDGAREGKHPFTIAKELRQMLGEGKRSAELIARTECAKMKSDIRFDTMREQGVHYFRYVTAGDSRVRKEHQDRNGKIYKAQDCPYMGEYNCRCVLVPADYEVEFEGATVSPSEAEYLTPEEAGI